MSCMCLSVETMGYSRDLLDVCFGDQLATTRKTTTNGASNMAIDGASVVRH